MTWPTSRACALGNSCWTAMPQRFPASWDNRVLRASRVRGGSARGRGKREHGWRAWPGQSAGARCWYRPAALNGSDFTSLMREVVMRRGTDQTRAQIMRRYRCAQ